MIDNLLSREADKVIHYLGVDEVESSQDNLDVVVEVPNLGHIELGQVGFAFVASSVNLDWDGRGIGLLDLTIFVIARILFEFWEGFLRIERNDSNVVG